MPHFLGQKSAEGTRGDDVSGPFSREMASPSSPCSRLLGTSTQPSKVHPMLQCRTGLDADGVRRVLGDEGTDSLTPRLGGHQMASVQDQLTILLRAYRTIRFCDACLAMKMGAFPRDVREAVVLIGEGFQISSGKCSECLREKTVVCALAA